MIEDFEQKSDSRELIRLASIPREKLEAVFIRRGYPEESIDDTIRGISDVGTPVTLEDAVSFPFRAKAHWMPPFGEGRFHQGHHFGVYYSALDFQTCCEEVFFHLREDGLEQTLARPRYYYVIESRFDGKFLDLSGQEANVPQLVSADHSGYPFCQRLASEARDAQIDALETRSARRAEGVCFPVLNENSMDTHAIARALRLIYLDGDIAVEDLQ